MSGRQRHQAATNSPFLTLNQVIDYTTLSRSTIYLQVADGSFPAPKKLGKRSIVWSKKEIENWANKVMR